MHLHIPSKTNAFLGQKIEYCPGGRQAVWEPYKRSTILPGMQLLSGDGKNWLAVF